MNLSFILTKGFCDEGLIFDAYELFCGMNDELNNWQTRFSYVTDIGDPEEATCWSDPEFNPPDDNDSDCPLDSDDVIFIPGDYCDEYFICHNGIPQLFECRAGQHWNKQRNFCDEPHLAGCDVCDMN